ncbi:MAG: CHAT domain-containing tetratricopeptide repeat protein, partial [Bacteroidota bacterium]
VKGEVWRDINRDSAYHYFDSAYHIYKKHQDWSSCMNVLLYINYTSGSYFDLEKHRQGLRMADSLLEKHRVHFDSIKDYQWYKNYLLLDKANYYSKIKDYKSVRKYTQRLRQSGETLPDSLRTTEDIEDIERSYKYEAQSYEGEEKYKMAQDLYEKSLRSTLERSDEKAARSVYRLLGSLYRKQQQYKKSNDYLKRGIEGETGEETRSKNSIVTSCYVMVRNYIDLKNTDSAVYYLRMADQQLTANDPLKYQYYQQLSEINKAIGDYEKALTTIDTALDLMTNSELQRTEHAELYHTKARIYGDMGNYQKTLENYQYAFKALSKAFLPKDHTENPAPESVANKMEYFRILKDKATALNKVRNFDAAVQTATIAVSLLDSLKPEFHEEDDKQLLIENSYSLFESGLIALIEEDGKTNNANRVDQAFFFMEKSKSTILLEAILSAYAYGFADIPQNLLEKELALKADINYIQKKVDKNNANTTWKDRLFEVRRQYRTLIREFEVNYPQYYDLKYNNNVVDTETLQQTLDNNTLLLSYFYGKEALYAVAISAATKEFVKIPLKDGLETQIRDLYTMLVTHDSDLKTLTAASNALYQNILHPLLKDKTHTRLMVMPDGILNYIPFEILHDGTQYVTERMTVSYAPSATLQQQLQRKKPENTRVLAFAPDFSTAVDLDPLPHAKKEVQHIRSYFKGRSYEDGEATLENFNAERTSYGIHHLATHAIVNDETPEYSYLAFTPESNNESLLYLSDIYTMKLNTAMVALSACESGIGDLKRGEGMISLSRAFFYAGAASIANTRWKINDNTTSQIMRNFYRQLSKGKKKDEALRLAKVEFMKKNYNNSQKHPYYWAGIVITGNTDAVTTSVSFWTWTLPLILIAVLMLWILRKKKRSTISVTGKEDAI